MDQRFTFVRFIILYFFFKEPGIIKKLIKTMDKSGSLKKKFPRTIG